VGDILDFDIFGAIWWTHL